jgi:hypothetical protein
MKKQSSARRFRMRRPSALLLIGALGLLIGALAVGGLTVWMDDDDAESRRAAALGDPPAPGEEVDPPGPQPLPPPPPPPWPNGESDVWEFRGSATALPQPPLGERIAIEGTLPPGRYYLYAKINMGSFATPGTPITVATGSMNWCDLKSGGPAVLDRTYTTHSYPGGYATTVLLAKHVVTTSVPSSATVRVICKNGTGGSIGSRVLTAMKVG